MTLQIGVKAIIKNSSDEYLFLRRSSLLSTDTDATSWDIPGGRININEKLTDALRREIKEEIGYNIQSAPTLIAAQDIFIPAKDIHVVRLTYGIEEDISEIVLSDEHEAYQWLNIEDVKMITTEPYLAEVLKIL